jgi:hypothetical protein
MLILIFSVLGIAAYGALIALFWEELYPTLAGLALLYHVAPESLDCLQPASPRSVPSDVNPGDQTGESDLNPQGPSVVIEAKSLPVEVDGCPAISVPRSAVD